MKEYGREHLENSKNKKNTKAERSRPMAKFDEWLTKDGLLRLEAWARAYIKGIGGFEKFAEWGLF